MTLGIGTIVDDIDYDNLFDTLEAIRAEHAARKGISDANKAKLNDKTLGGNVVTVNAGDKVAQAQAQDVFDALAFIEAFAVDMSGFAAQIPVPAVGDLLKATTLPVTKTIVQTVVDDVCAHCSFNSGYNSSVCGFNSGHNPFGSWNSSWNGVFC